MKKILIAIIVIVVVGVGVYYSQRSQRNEDSGIDQTDQEGSATPSPSPAIGPGPTEGNLGGQAPTPSPTPTSPPPPSPSPAPSPSPTPPPPPPAPQIKTFNITGRNFAFSTTEIRAKKGDTVKINFQSTEGFHNWTLEGYGVGTQTVNAPGSSSVEFVADKTGSFTYYCSVGNHRELGMVGTLIVE